MKIWFDRRKIIYGIAAAVIFAVLYAVTFRSHAERGELEQVELVAFGDSVFTDIGELTPVPEILSELLDISVYNAAMGGTCAARLEKERRLDYAGGSLSLVGLTGAICADDFSVQQSAKIRDSNTERFPAIVDGLAAIDFDQVEIVLMEKGINDYHAGVRIENPQDPYDEYTFLGALRSAVEDLRRVNQDVRILMITPTYTWYRDIGKTCEETDNGGGLLEAYVEAEIGLAGEMGVEVIDLYHDFFPHEKWDDWERYTMDGLHPNEAGREKIAQKIADVLQSGQKQ